MKLAVMLFALVISGAVADSSLRRLQTIGPDDVAAASAVGEAVIQTGISAKKVAADIAHAKAHEARVAYLADKKVARAVTHAMKHSGGHLEHALSQKASLQGGLVGGVAAASTLLGGLESAKLSVHDEKRIAHAMARAARMKAHAKQHTVKVVVKSVGDAAANDLAYGAKAVAAIGNAALNDVSTFVPILSGLAPTFLPQLASVASMGPSGLVGLLGNLAQSIGGALMGNSNIGVAGPDLLATRVVSMLPNDLLSSLVDGVSSGGGLSPAGLNSIIQSIPPQVLDSIVSFLSTGSIPGAPASLPGLGGLLPGGLPLPSGPRGAVEELIHLPENALQALMHSLTSLMNGGSHRGAQHGLFNLPRLPGGGLPMPLKALSNLLGVLPHPDLSAILKMLPRNPLTGLIRGLPLGVQEE